LPAYRFEALDAAGKSQSGLVEADNSRAARSQLRSQQLVPLAVTQVATEQSVVAGFSLTRKVFNATALAIWTRQLAGLVGSGLPLERALTALADEAEGGARRDAALGDRRRRRRRPRRPRRVRTGVVARARDRFGDGPAPRPR